MAVIHLGKDLKIPSRLQERRQPVSESERTDVEIIHNYKYFGRSFSTTCDKKINKNIFKQNNKGKKKNDEC